MSRLKSGARGNTLHLSMRRFAKAPIDTADGQHDTALLDIALNQAPSEDLSAAWSPPWLHLAASVVSWEEVARLNGATSGATALTRRNPLSETLQLRWMVPPYIGLPRKPSTTWIFTGEVTLKLQPESGVPLYGGVQRIDFPDAMAMLVFGLDLTAAGAYVFAYSAAGQLLTGATSDGTTGVVVLEIQNSAIDYILIGGTGSVGEIFWDHRCGVR